MVSKGKGVVVILGFGVVFVGVSNMVVYVVLKVFDMVFVEVLFCEFKFKGVDVLGLILGEMDIFVLWRLCYNFGLVMGLNEVVKGVEILVYVVDDCLVYLIDGFICLVNWKMCWGFRFLFLFFCNFIVFLMDKVNKKVMGKG